MVFNCATSMARSVYSSAPIIDLCGCCLQDYILPYLYYLRGRLRQTFLVWIGSRVRTGSM